LTRIALTLTAAMLLTACGDSAPTFGTVEITLPEDTATFPAGPGVEAITTNCTACHSPDMILNQPALTRDQWRSSIGKMREVYKATIDPAAEEAILDYLMARDVEGR
jgi:mono/diheme cytochrome c family protein